MTTHPLRQSLRWALLVAASALLAAPALAGSDTKPGVTPNADATRAAEPVPSAAAPPEKQSPPKTNADILYVPPSIGSPFRTIGAGTRGMGRHASLQILAPDHLGYTSGEQPTLYWYLAEPTTARIDFTLRDETSVEPIVDVELPSPAQGGIQAVRLADHGVRLRPGENYQWFVSLVLNPERRSKDFTMGAWISRREPDAALETKLAAAGGREATLYAEGGFWYDAIGTLSSEIAASPQDASLRGERALLLEQAGLSEVAAYDRAAASH